MLNQSNTPSAASSHLLALHLISGADYAQREASIAQALAEHNPALALASPSNQKIAVILEGLPSGSMPLTQWNPPPAIQVARIAPGCFCCIGNLTMRVTLNRLLREKPSCLYLAIASSEHLQNLLQVLASAPYVDLLQLASHQALPNAL